MPSDTARAARRRHRAHDVVDDAVERVVAVAPAGYSTRNGSVRGRAPPVWEHTIPRPRSAATSIEGGVVAGPRVVDQVGALVGGRPRHLRAPGVDADHQVRVARPGPVVTSGITRAISSAASTRGPAAGPHPAEVDDVGALVDRPRHGVVGGRVVEPRRGVERVRRPVDDGHDDRATGRRSSGPAGAAARRPAGRRRHRVAGSRLGGLLRAARSRRRPPPPRPAAGHPARAPGRRPPAAVSTTLRSSRSAVEIMPRSSTGAAHPVDEALPVVAADEHDREADDLVRLHQGQRLEQLVERAEAARQHHEALGVLHEHRLAREEVPEVDAEVDVVVHALLERQLDAEPDGQPAGLQRPRLAASMIPGPPPVITA